MASEVVHIDEPALLEAIEFIRTEKEVAIDEEHFDMAFEWRNAERSILLAIARGGLLERISSENQSS
jgi:hypothetical protein